MEKSEKCPLCFELLEELDTGVLIDAEFKKNLQELTGIELDTSAAVFSCENCRNDLQVSLLNKERFMKSIKILNDQEERRKIPILPDTLKEDDWLTLAPEMWIQIMSYLSRNDLNNMHLVSKNFHEILNEHFDHQMFLKNNSADQLEALKKSSRRYDEANIRIAHQETAILAIESLFQNFGVHLKQLVLDFYSINSDGNNFFDPAKFLKFLPNLERLEFMYFKNKRFQSAQQLNLPKLKYLKTLECHNSILSVLGECEKLEEVEFVMGGNGRAFLKNFIMLNQKSLTKIALYGMNHPGFLPLLIEMKEIKLEFLILETIEVINSQVLQEFLKTQADTMKTLEFHKLDVLDRQFLEFVCEKLQKLECLSICKTLDCRVERFDGFNQLRNLKHLGIDKCDVLHGLALEVNGNLKSLDVPLDYLDFDDDNDIQLLNDLQTCLPNLKSLTLNGRENLLPAFLPILNYFRNLENLKWRGSDAVNNFLQILEEITKEKIHNANLKKISVPNDDYYIHSTFRLGKLKFEW